jgi:hypothetical protein
MFLSLDVLCTVYISRLLSAAAGVGGRQIKGPSIGIAPPLFDAPGE